MNNPNDVVQNKHLDALAARIADNIGGSGGSSGQIVLGITEQTVNGGLWYEVEGGVPAIKMRYGNSIYSFTSSVTVDVPTPIANAYPLYASNNRIIAYLPERELVMIPYEQLENELSGDDYSAVMDLIDAENAYAEENNLLLADLLYFVAPDNLPANFAYINILRTFDTFGTPREVHINGEPVEFTGDYNSGINFKLTEFGLVTIFVDAEEA